MRLAIYRRTCISLDLLLALCADLTDPETTREAHFRPSSRQIAFPPRDRSLPLKEGIIARAEWGIKVRSSRTRGLQKRRRDTGKSRWIFPLCLSHFCVLGFLAIFLIPAFLLPSPVFFFFLLRLKSRLRKERVPGSRLTPLLDVEFYIATKRPLFFTADGLLTRHNADNLWKN